MVGLNRVCWLVVGVCLAQPALAEPSLPNWDPSEICKKDSSPGQCAAFEARARNAVSGSWGILLEATKKACLEAVKSPLDQSWRLLAGCIDEQAATALTRHNAIATRFTPAEPVPPPAAATEPAAVPGTLSGAPATGPALTDGVPPPPFQVPTAAPKIQ